MFLTNTVKFSEKTFYQVKKSDGWQNISYNDFASQVFLLASALKEEGLKKGDKVAVIMDNRPEWAMIDYACQVSGLISVPIYTTLLGKQAAYILNDSEAKIAFIDNEYQWEKMDSVKNSIKHVNKYIQVEGEISKGNIKFNDFLESGKKTYEKDTGWIKKIVEKTDDETIATIIYTSGTTGNPKGVMLKHSNFLHNIEGVLLTYKIDSSDNFLSFLPLSHVFERMAGHFLPCHQGSTIAYAEGIESVALNLTEIKPTIMTSVPRFYEKVYGRILASVEEGSAVKRFIFDWANSVGKRRYKYKITGKKVPAFLNTRYNVASKLVFSKLQQKVGGNIRFFISGGAPLSKEIGEFFAFADILILEGYGLTETSPVISANDEQHYKFGTVGLPLPNNEVKIAEDGEILTRGKHVMAGYFNNKEETREMIDDDGWLYTGDIGYFDKDGFLVITDRKKNIIVTSGGKNIAPQPIENKLLTSRLIEQVVVVGNSRKFC
ncbi:MAG: long-chain fatty acid--CoA ligase, partial [Calditrichia bacterium]|nr:long-chain fatty acid--CoA ligase [Calditrichia bacterium]